MDKRVDYINHSLDGVVNICREYGLKAIIQWNGTLEDAAVVAFVPYEAESEGKAFEEVLLIKASETDEKEIIFYVEALDLIQNNFSLMREDSFKADDLSDMREPASVAYDVVEEEILPYNYTDDEMDGRRWFFAMLVHGWNEWKSKSESDKNLDYESFIDQVMSKVVFKHYHGTVPEGTENLVDEIRACLRRKPIWERLRAFLKKTFCQTEEPARFTFV